MSDIKKNIVLKDTCEVHRYTSDGTNGKRNILNRDRKKHGKMLLKQLETLWKSDEQQKAMFATIKDRNGTYIEFKGAPNCELVYKSLENVKQGIQLLNIRNENISGGATVQSATVFVPEGKEKYFNNKIQEYLDKEKDTKKNNPKNKDLIESIETIELAVISSFWIGNIDDIPGDKTCWCEFWLRTKVLEEVNISKKFFELCDRLHIQYNQKCIVFPEKIVVLAKTNKDNIKELLNNNGYIAEIRRAPEVASFYTNMGAYETKEWIIDLKERMIINKPASYICILDTGINNKHPLLKDVLKNDNMQSVDISWGNDDRNGHGTQMAGICQYYDLEPILTGNDIIELNHALESVKILPSDGKHNAPELYGAITANATSLAEITNPQAKRVFCMAVTADKYITSDGAPSSWSAELDNIISGVDDNIRKLFVVSAGNVEFNELENIRYPDVNVNHSVEDPGQSWNALTIGAYSKRIMISDNTYEGWKPIADVGELCPFSSTSTYWDKKWPIKPEILFDGGNAITDGVHIDICDDVSILTTYNNHNIRAFTTINATSAATAQAAYMAGVLMSEYPTLWEETIRALMVHSAEWTENMKKQFCIDDKRRTGRKTLLHCCGYGVADLDRARNSMNNAVNMIIQEELQPYCKEGYNYKTNEMHLHELPWPSDLLQNLGNTEVRVKVTLSYYIEPAPDQKGWNNKYRYASSGLRFELINKNQTKEDFLKRVNAASRGEDKEDKGDGDNGSGRWFLGKENRDVGSIHSDTWTGAAVDLAECKYIAVYPVIGWWRERHNLGRFNDKMRYALIVSISTPDESIDFYTPIKTIIEQKIENKVEVKI